MKFNVSSRTLYNYASAVSKIINSKSPIQVLNNLQFTLEGDTLTIKGADLDNFIYGRMQVTGAEGSGSFCLDARRIVELLKLMPDQGLTFQVDENLEVNIDYTTGYHKTMAISGDEFPVSDNKIDPANVESFVASGQTVMSGMDNTIFAVGDDEIRPQMMGVLWDVKPDKLIFVATDTRKLVRCINTATHPDVECSFILPTKSASILRTVFSDAENIKVSVSPVNVLFESEDFTFNCRLINGRYPDYNRVIPASNPYTLTVDRLTLLSAVRRVAVGGDDGCSLVKVRLADNDLTLQSADVSYNTFGFEKVNCDYEGQDLLIGFDSSYLIDILNTFSCTDVIMRLGDPSRPALLEPAEQDPDYDLDIILMPMNIIS